MDNAERYDDIIHLPRPRSERHPPMSMHERAAQFSPFAALTGYSAAVRETARLTECRIEPDEETRRRLSEQLTLLAAHAASHPDVTITFFRPDPRKSGGAYLRVTGTLKEIDPTARWLTLTDSKKIPLDDIYSVDSPLFIGMGFD